MLVDLVIGKRVHVLKLHKNGGGSFRVLVEGL